MATVETLQTQFHFQYIVSKQGDLGWSGIAMHINGVSPLLRPLFHSLEPLFHSLKPLFHYTKASLSYFKISLAWHAS